MVIETDQKVGKEIIDKLEVLEGINKVLFVDVDE